jgi:hypothetical protein
MLVELTVQLQQLADMQQQQMQERQQQQQQQRSSGGGSTADAAGVMSPASKAARPAWGGVLGSKAQHKPEEQVQRQHSAKVSDSRLSVCLDRCILCCSPASVIPHDDAAYTASTIIACMCVLQLPSNARCDAER